MHSVSHAGRTIDAPLVVFDRARLPQRLATTRVLWRPPVPFMTPDYLEALVTWAGEPSEAAVQWFEQRGFAVVRLKRGLLLHAQRSLVESVFGVQLRDAPLPVRLPVPQAREQEIASITVVRPREYSETQERKPPCNP